MDFLTEKAIAEQTDAALAWLRRSIEATGGRGSAHSFSPFFGWRAAYPETTGYLIETLFDFSRAKNDPSLAELAKKQALWLTEIQRPDGAFQSSTVDKTAAPSSFFNTGQILFGLARAADEWPEKRPFLIEKARKAAVWMAENIQPDGSCRDFLYVPGRSATYQTRAIWGLLAAAEALKKWPLPDPPQPGGSQPKAAAETPFLTEAARRAMAFYAQKSTPDGRLLDCAFFEKKAAPTHTIAYALRGFLESGLLLNDEKLVEIAAVSMKKLLSKREKASRTAGAYFDDGRGDFSFRCLTGQFQLSLACSRLFEVTGEAIFRAGAEAFFAEGAPFQCRSKSLNRRGAFAGSAPFWGGYMAFRYPNWATKFYLDAAFHLRYLNEQK